MLNSESRASASILDAGPGAPVVSVKPVILAASSERGEDLQVKVSAPAEGSALPVIVFSHGQGSSFDGYGPLADFWAAHGFVVIQPTHLDSRTIGLIGDDPRAAQNWRIRVEDLHQILDQLDDVVSAVPGLRGRVDSDRIAVAGHSFGGQSSANLLGLRVRDPETGELADRSDPRVRAGVLLATAGEGGENLTAFAAEHLPWMNPDFSTLTTPTLVVYGDHDEIPRKYQLTVRGADWLVDPYRLSPGAESLLTVHGAEHSLGGVVGYEVAETTDEDPARVQLIQQVTWAYLRHALGIEETSWRAARAALAGDANPLGRVESK